MSLAWLPVVLASGLALGAEPSVSIEVDVLGASDQAPKTAQAPDAAKVSSHLERDLRTTLKFKHYRELAKRDLAVALAATGEMTLPNGGQLKLTPLSFDPVKGMLELRVR